MQGINYHPKFKKCIAFFLANLMWISLIFSYSTYFMGSGKSEAMTIETTVTYYSLDTGVQIWWSDDGGKTYTLNGQRVGYNAAIPISVTHNIPKGAKVVRSGIYNSNATKGQAGYFPFEDSADGSEIAIWAGKNNSLKYGSGKKDYFDYYYSYMPKMTLTSSPDSETVEFSMKRNEGTYYDLKSLLSDTKGKQFVLDMLGGNPGADLKKLLKLNDMSKGETFSANQKGELYFTPTVVEYTITTTQEIPDLHAHLSLPSSAETGESYTIKDTSELSSSIYPYQARLEKSRDKNTWTQIAIWNGDSSMYGKNTGGSIQDSESTPGTVYYRITVVSAPDYKTDSETKAIVIYEGDPPEEDEEYTIDGEAILNIPSVTYEGHQVAAKDESSFKVNGKFMSAKTAYKDEYAKHYKLTTTAADGTVTNWSDYTNSTLVFPTKGTYRVTLTVDLLDKNGKKVKTLKDTKEIEVLNSPKIIDNLGGKQKANRKQILNVSVATHPKVALKTLWIELETETGTQKVKLTDNKVYSNQFENTLNNSGLIKTRAIEHLSSSNEYFTNIQLLFLTKNANEQVLRYRIYAEDVNGESDMVEKEFTVVPDLAPEANPYTAETTLRNEDSNDNDGKGGDADIWIEDKSTTDSGDQLERTWYYRFSESDSWKKCDSSFSDMSFGKQQLMQQHKEGVGKVYYKLCVKDKWTDETLEEYITDDDYLTATGYTKTDVINIAPVVSLELKKTVSARISVVGGSQENIDTLEEAEAEVKEKLMKNDIKAEISFNTLKGDIVADDSEELSKIARSKNNSIYLSYDENGEYGLGNNVEDTFLENNGFAADNDNMYYIIPNYEESMYTTYATKSYNASFSQPLEIRAICLTDEDKNDISVSDQFIDLETTGNILWSMNLTEDMLKISDWRSGKLVTDKSDRYIFFVNGGKTAVLNRDTGEYLTTLNTELGDDTYSTNKYVYTFKNDGIYRISTGSGDSENIYSKYIATKEGTQSQDVTGYDGYTRIHDNTVEFICKEDGIYKRGYLNLSKGKIRTETISEIDNTAVWYSMGFDINGNVALLNQSSAQISIYDIGNLLTKSKTGLSTNNTNFFIVNNTYGEFTYIGCISKGAVSIYGINTNDSYSISGTYPSDSYQSANNKVVGAVQEGNTVYIDTPHEICGDIYWDNASGYEDNYSKRNGYVIYTDGSQENECNSSMHFSGVAAGAGDSEYTRISGNIMVSSETRSGSNKFDGRIRVRGKEYIRTIDNALNRSISDSFVNDSSELDKAKVLVIYDNVNAVSSNGNYSVERIIENNIKVVFVTDNGNGSLSTYQSMLKSKIEASGKKTFTANVNNADSIAAEIITAINTDQNANAYKLTNTETTGTGAATLSRTFDAKAGKTYYYEYSIKADNNAAMTYENNMSDKYIQKSSDGYYIPELSDKVNIEKQESQMLVDYRDSGKGSKSRASNPNCYDDYEFTVPTGMKAILSFDYNYYYYRYDSGSCAEVSLDDTLLINCNKRNNYDSSYTYSSFIGPGNHTLKANVTDNGLLDYIEATGIKIIYVPERAADNYTVSSLLEIINSYCYQDDDKKVYYTNSSKALNDTIISDLREQYNSNSSARSYTSSNQFTVDVPEGKKACLKFDYEFYYNKNTSNQTYIKTTINSKSIKRLSAEYSDENKDTGIYEGTYVLFCDEGTNTINVDIKDYISKKSSGSEYFAISNITLDYVDEIVSGTGEEDVEKAKLLNPKESVTEKGDSWKSVSGSFKAPFKNYCYAYDLMSDEVKLSMESQETFTFTALSLSDMYIKDLKIYTTDNGEKIYLNDANPFSRASMSKWEVVGGNITVENVEIPQEEPKPQMVYEKGETVNYEVYYSDYENDPKKKSYWRYTHTPYEDGANAEAAYIKDKSGSVISSDDSKILQEPIESFDIDGKYTVEHWVEDDTGNADYDLESNHVYITFYIKSSETPDDPDEPEKNPPEAISIKPDKTVKYGDSFALIGTVQDEDKDDLDVNISLLYQGKEIYNYSISSFKYDETLGKYPDITTAIACYAATDGDYTAVLEVSDDDYPVPDIISYTFTVEKNDPPVITYLNTVPETGADKEPIYAEDSFKIKGMVYDSDYDSLTSRIVITDPNGKKYISTYTNVYNEEKYNDILSESYTAVKGTYTVIVTTNDGKHSDVSKTYSFTVIDNAPPQITYLNSYPETSEEGALPIYEGDSFSYRAMVDDKELDELTVILKLSYNGNVIESNTFSGVEPVGGMYPTIKPGRVLRAGALEFCDVYTTAKKGTYKIECWVYDNRHLSSPDYKSHSFTVAENKAPEITYLNTYPDADKNFYTGEEFSYKATVDDNEKDTLLVKFVLTRNGELVDEQEFGGVKADEKGKYPELKNERKSGSFEYKYYAAEKGVYNLECMVYDDWHMDSPTYKVYVFEVKDNAAPVITYINTNPETTKISSYFNGVISTDETFGLLSKVDDEEHDPLTVITTLTRDGNTVYTHTYGYDEMKYSLSEEKYPDVTTHDRCDFTSQPGTYILRTTVYDKKHDSTPTVATHIFIVNSAPEVSKVGVNIALDKLRIKENTPFKLDAIVDDYESDSLSYTLKLTQNGKTVFESTGTDFNVDENTGAYPEISPNIEFKFVPNSDYTGVELVIKNLSDNTQITKDVNLGTFKVEIWANDAYHKNPIHKASSFNVEKPNAPPTPVFVGPYPAALYEGDDFSIKGMVTDEEHDPLKAVIELYNKDTGELIYTYTKDKITYNKDSEDYPVINTDNVPGGAVKGNYTIVIKAYDDFHVDPGVLSYDFSIVNTVSIDGHVNHTDTWNINRQNYNNYYFEDPINKRIEYSEYKTQSIPRKRGINIFWVGEKFVLSADVGGQATSVTVKIEGTAYETELSDSGETTTDGKSIYVGSLWDASMKEIWGIEPQELTFTFKATFTGSRTATDTETVVVDDSDLYWDYHRKY